MAKNAAFASASRFDVLAVDNPHEEEEEEEEEEPIVETKPEPVLSKSARKKLARAEKEAGVKEEDNNGRKQGTNGHAEGLAAVVDSVSTTTANAVSDGVKKAQTVATDITTSAAKAASTAVSQGKATASDVAASVSKAATAVSESKAANAVSAPAAKPKIHQFNPSLPDVPTPAASSLPENRKRKTPQDFTPSGPHDVPTPSSPSKNSVKFEDGVAPGEGAGEKTIPKNRNAVERTIWTFIMIFGFIALLCLGHPYMILLVLLCQSLVYKEVTALFELRDAQKTDDPWSKTLNWYFFVVTNYFLYGESIIYYFKHIVFVDAWFIPFARNHRFISFMLYVVGFVGFVANLQRQHLRRQFALFCWVHITLLLIVVSSHFIVNNILEGHVWFFIPASLVICNDVMAYVCGKLFGRTPLIKLSPKKTVEGFVGAYFCTLVFGYLWATLFMRFPYMTCPAKDLGTNVFSHITCKPNPVFVWREVDTAFGTLSYAPFQIHALVMATFASLVAPFGGFFASGFKRAFNVKDFGHSIPGHGGMTDRMDCQFMMGMFSYVYYSSLIRVQHVDIGSVMQTIVTSLEPQEQLELLADLKRFLEGQGLAL